MRLADESLHSPHLLDVEYLHAVRTLVFRKKIDVPRAHAAVDDFGRLEIVRYPHGPLRSRMWELRDNLSAYDASYVALAEAFAMPLLTSDARIAATPGVRAEIRVLAD